MRKSARWAFVPLSCAIIAGCAGTAVGSEALSPPLSEPAGARPVGGILLPPANFGAELPISYDLASLAGTRRYVAVDGREEGNDCTDEASPCVTIARAHAAANPGDSIVVRGGVYRQAGLQSNFTISKSVKIVAYPGEIPVFNGAREVVDDWLDDARLKYIDYVPQPVTDGSGISFTTGMNLIGDGVGKFPDQVWIGSDQLQQVAAREEVAVGKFWVDQERGRLYLHPSDAAQSGIEVSEVDDWATIAAPDVTIEGIVITRYSNSADDYGVLDISATADGVTLRNVEISDAAFQTLSFNGKDADQIVGGLLDKVTVRGANWMGVVAVYTDGVTLRDSLFTGLNRWGEFASSPQSGAVKTSRTRRTKVVGNSISNNRGQGLWFDQSNYDVEVAANVIVGNSANGVFFEISDKLLLINNIIRADPGATGASVKLAGSSGLRLVNNTIVGGADGVGIYVDKRSLPGCSDPLNALCSGSLKSDRDIARKRPPTLDWMPRLDLMLNNIVAYPTDRGLCGERLNLCITDYNRIDKRNVAEQPLEAVLHPADPARGIAATFMGGNVYANGDEAIIGVPNPANDRTIALDSVAEFEEFVAEVSVGGLEATSLVGDGYVNADGSPTEELSALHGSAQPAPADAEINRYIPAGTRHFGAIHHR